MLGHLVPQGTGSFDLLLDHHMLADAHQAVQYLPPPGLLDQRTQQNDTTRHGMLVQASPSRDGQYLELHDLPFSPGTVSPGQCHSKPFPSSFFFHMLSIESVQT
jgi:hypothetical protein